MDTQGSYGDQCKTGKTDPAKYLKEQGKGEPTLCVCPVCLARGRGELPTSWSPVANINIRRDLMMDPGTVNVWDMYRFFNERLREVNKFVEKQAEKLLKNEISISEAYQAVMEWLEEKTSSKFSRVDWLVIFDAVRFSVVQK